MKITKEGLYTTYHDVAVVQGGTPEWGTEWWTEKQWEEHRESEKKLKASGQWGKKAYYDISIVNNPLYDDVRITPQAPLHSAELVWLDFEKGNITQL